MQRQCLPGERRKPTLCPCVRQIGIERFRHGNSEAPSIDEQLTALVDQTDVEEIHRRRTDEAGNETVDRPGIDFHWRAALLHNPLVHDEDASAMVMAST
jgi:hypothetical protein